MRPAPSSASVQMFHPLLMPYCILDAIRIPIELYSALHTALSLHSAAEELVRVHGISMT